MSAALDPASAGSAVRPPTRDAGDRTPCAIGARASKQVRPRTQARRRAESGERPQHGARIQAAFQGVFERVPSDRVRTLDFPMETGTWQSTSARTPMCGRSRGARVSATTASVLVRRGTATSPMRARFLEGALPGHDPFALGDMRAAVEAIGAAVEARRAHLRARRLRRRRHLRHGARRAPPARARGATPSWHLPSRFEEGYGLNGQTLTRLAEEGVDLVLTVDCGITAVAEVEHARALGLEVVVTDHHRPADDVPRLPGRRAAEGRLSVRGPLRHRRRLEARPGAARPGASVPRPPPRRGRARDRRRRRAARRREPRARAARPAPARADAEAGPARADARRAASTRRRSTRARSASGSRRGSTRRAGSAARGGARAAADRRRRRGEELAEELEELNRERQAVEERISRAAIAEIESWPEARRRHRGYVVAGEDWHEGVIGIVASRLVERYGRPVVLIAGTDGEWKGSGRSMPAFDLHGALAACAAHLERFGGHRAAAGLTIRPEQRRGVRGGVRGARRRGARRRRPAPADARRRGRPGRGARARPLRGARAARAVRARQPGRDAARRRLRAREPLDRRRRQAPALPRPPARPRRGLGDRVRPRRPARPLPARRALRRRVPPAGEPLERHRLAAARRAADLRRADGSRSCARGSPTQWRAGEAAWTPEARAIFAELELADGAGRSLLESETFRALLETSRRSPWLHDRKTSSLGRARAERQLERLAPMNAGPPRSVS